jgi:hypothetical protein
VHSVCPCQDFTAYTLVQVDWRVVGAHQENHWSNYEQQSQSFISSQQSEFENELATSAIYSKQQK